MSKAKAARFVRAVDAVSTACAVIAGLCLAAAMLIVCYMVIWRATGHSTYWEIELATYLIVASVLIGSPYTGKYRKAAVIHDTLCAVKDRPWKEAHWIFREMLRALGVGRLRARLMYVALLLGGTKW